LSGCLGRVEEDTAMDAGSERGRVRAQKEKALRVLTFEKRGMTNSRSQCGHSVKRGLLRTFVVDVVENVCALASLPYTWLVKGSARDVRREAVCGIVSHAWRSFVE